MDRARRAHVEASPRRRLIRILVRVDLDEQAVAARAAVPVWVRLARAFEKRHLWLFAMVQGGIGYGLIFTSLVTSEG